MNRREFYFKLKKAALPVVVDLWAPWCGPCRAMEPAFKKATQKYEGQVEVWKINADEAPDVLSGLGVIGIPTVIAFAQENEIMRRAGMQDAGMLDLVFEAAVRRRKPDVMPVAANDRMMRTGSGLFLLIMGWYTGMTWWVLGLGMVLILSAFYDRIPISRAMAPRLKAIFRPPAARPTSHHADSP